MRKMPLIRLGALIASAALIALPTLSTTALAQGFFNWNLGTEPMNWGGKTKRRGGSGRETISFPSGYSPGQILVSFTDRKLYYVNQRGSAISYPIATPRSQSRWQGAMRISRKKVNPTWTPTPSMRRENPSLPVSVPGGHPRNPLGSRALYLGSSLYRIHGTDAPWTIGQPVSKGCVRMYNADVQDLYRRVNVGTLVTVTWKSFSSSY